MKSLSKKRIEEMLSEAIEMNACQNCQIHNNVIFGIYKEDESGGVGIAGLNNTSTSYAGTSIYNNWIVNTSVGIEFRAADADDSGRDMAVVHNYVSHTRAHGIGAAMMFSNVIKNWDLNDTVTGSGVKFPRIYRGNVLMTDIAVSAGAPCDVDGCSRYGIEMNALNYTSDVEITDTLIYNSNDDDFTGSCVFLNFGSTAMPNDVTVSHLTCDAAGESTGAVVLSTSKDPDLTKTFTANDIFHAFSTGNSSSRAIVNCSAQDNIIDVVGNLFSANSYLAADKGGTVESVCDEGSVTQTMSGMYQYRDRLAIDFNLVDGADALTAAADGGPIGIRAFRFDRARLNDVWSDTLTFDYTFPKNIANVSNVDTDGDGVIDLHDNCDGVWNPSQLDTNENDKGDACDRGLN